MDGHTTLISGDVKYEPRPQPTNHSMIKQEISQDCSLDVNYSSLLEVTHIKEKNIDEDAPDISNQTDTSGAVVEETLGYFNIYPGHKEMVAVKQERTDKVVQKQDYCNMKGVMGYVINDCITLKSEPMETINKEHCENQDSQLVEVPGEFEQKPTVSATTLQTTPTDKQGMSPNAIYGINI